MSNSSFYMADKWDRGIDALDGSITCMAANVDSLSEGLSAVQNRLTALESSAAASSAACYVNAVTAEPTIKSLTFDGKKYNVGISNSVNDAIAELNKKVDGILEKLAGRGISLENSFLKPQSRIRRGEFKTLR